jgi:hypothetical protein
MAQRSGQRAGLSRISDSTHKVRRQQDRQPGAAANAAAVRAPGITSGVLQLQRAAGNQAVSRALAARPGVMQLTDAGQAARDPMPARSAANRGPSGLPAGLRRRVEQLSGVAMDGVKVHYDSPEPAQVQALAFTKGTDIHVAPGQEKHIAHEAWHVVQQAQGRVNKTTQLKSGVAVNDDLGLEREADLMGAKASQMEGHAPEAQDARRELTQPGTAGAAVQRKAVANVSSVGLFRDVGNGLYGSDTPVTKLDVLAVVRAIRASDDTTGERTNIKILTGTHGTAQGHLVGEPIFFQEDLANEGHKGGGGWVNVMSVRNKSKSQVAGWKDSRSNFAVILAWCYSAQSEANWANVNATWGKKDGQYVWAW